MLACGGVDCGFEFQSSQPKDYRIGIYCLGVRANTGWLNMPIGAICLTTDCCFCELAL